MNPRQFFESFKKALKKAGVEPIGGGVFHFYIDPPVKTPSSFLLRCVRMDGPSIHFGGELLKGPIIAVFPDTEWVGKQFRAGPKAFADVKAAVDHILNVRKKVTDWRLGQVPHLVVQ